MRADGTATASGSFRCPAATAAGRLVRALGDSARHRDQRGLTHVQDDAAALTSLSRACTHAGKTFAAPRDRGVFCIAYDLTPDLDVDTMDKFANHTID